MTVVVNHNFIDIGEQHPVPLLEMIALSVVQSFAGILIHNAILFINTTTMFGTTIVIG